APREAGGCGQGRVAVRGSARLGGAGIRCGTVLAAMLAGSRTYRPAQPHAAITQGEPHMQVPPEIAFRDIEPTDELKALILDGIDKLETVYPNLISCRAVVTDTTPGRNSGNNYRVRLEISIPHKTVMVDEDTP